MTPLCEQGKFLKASASAFSCLAPHKVRLKDEFRLLGIWEHTVDLMAILEASPPVFMALLCFFFGQVREPGLQGRHRRRVSKTLWQPIVYTCEAIQTPLVQSMVAKDLSAEGFKMFGMISCRDAHRAKRKCLTQGRMAHSKDSLM